MDVKKTFDNWDEWLGLNKDSEGNMVGADNGEQEKELADELEM